MQIGDTVRWVAPGDENIVFRGIVRQLDGNPPDAAMVEETLASHRTWGESDVEAGTMHSVLVKDLEEVND